MQRFFVRDIDTDSFKHPYCSSSTWRCAPLWGQTLSKYNELFIFLVSHRKICMSVCRIVEIHGRPIVGRPILSFKWTIFSWKTHIHSTNFDWFSFFLYAENSFLSSPSWPGRPTNCVFYYHKRDKDHGEKYTQRFLWQCIYRTTSCAIVPLRGRYFSCHRSVKEKSHIFHVRQSCVIARLYSKRLSHGWIKLTFDKESI